MARKTTKKKEDNFKEFKFDGKEFQYTGRLYPESAVETDKSTRTPFSLTLNGVLTIKGCWLWQTDKSSWIKFPEFKSGEEYKSYVYYPKELNDELGELLKVMEETLD